jgi:hypothetical protein
VFVWYRLIPTLPNCCTRIEGRTIKPDGTLSPVQIFSPPPSQRDHNTYQPRVGVDANGKAFLMWEFRDEFDIIPEAWVEARTRSPGGALGPVMQFGGSTVVHDLELATSANGYAAFAWTESHHSGGYAMSYVTIRKPAGGFHGTGLNTTGSAYRPAVDLSGTGAAVVAWELYGDFDETYEGVAARTIATNGALGPVSVLSATGLDPRIAVNGAGSAVAAWADVNDFSSPVIRAAVGP